METLQKNIRIAAFLPNGKLIVADSSGKKAVFSSTIDGRNAGKWYENIIDTKLYGNVLDMNFNETNGELVSIISDGTIVYSHELYCKYHGSTRIITNLNVDTYDFTGVVCQDRVKEDLRSNGAVI